MGDDILGRKYSVPPDTNEKEKIVGGILTFAQMVYLVLGVFVSALFGGLIGYLTNFYVGACIFLLGSFTVGPFFSFMKFDGYPVDQYLILSRKHKRTGKKILYIKDLG